MIPGYIELKFCSLFRPTSGMLMHYHVTGFVLYFRYTLIILLFRSVASRIVIKFLLVDYISEIHRALNQLLYFQRSSTDDWKYKT